MSGLIESFYDREATVLAPRYEELDPADIYSAALGFLPEPPSAVLDVAAGSGRDAAWLRRMGHRVTAVDPSAGMLAQARRLHPDAGIRWIDSRLPALVEVPRPPEGFAFILAAAVWMHLEDHDRQEAWNSLARLAAPGATVIVTLRHGPGEPERPMYPIDRDIEIDRAIYSGFSSVWVLPNESSKDLLGRHEVTWETLVAIR